MGIRCYEMTTGGGKGFWRGRKRRLIGWKGLGQDDGAEKLRG